MAVKIYFNDLIHRISGLPTSFDLLIALITSLFSTSLPQSWSLQYLDQDGEKVSITDKTDYESIIEIESQSPASTFKIYIVANAPPRISQQRDFLSAFELTESEICSQSNVSEASEYEIIRSLIESDSFSRPNIEAKKSEEDKRFGQARYLINKLVKGELSAADCAQISARLNSLLENFTLEQKERLHPRRYDSMEFSEFIESSSGSEMVPVEVKKVPTGNNFTCNGCNVKGITGVRYKCSVCKDFSFCENCEETKEHAHPFLKLRKPVAQEQRIQSRYAGREWGFFRKFCLIGEVMMKIGQQPREKRKRIFKIFKVFAKLFKARNNGDEEKIRERQAKLLSYLPEESKRGFKEEFEAIPAGLSKKELGEKLFVLGIKYYQVYCPGNDALMMELESFGQEMGRRCEARKKRMAVCREMANKRCLVRMMFTKPVMKMILVAVLAFLFIPKCH